MRFLSIIGILSLTLCFNSFAQDSQRVHQKRISDDLYYNKIDEMTYVITHYFPRWGGNCLFVLVGDREAVLIDTPYEDSGTKALYDWMSESFGKLSLTVINTGYHQDNLGGNRFLQSVGAEIYGSDLTKKLIIEKGAELKELIVNSVKDEPSKRFLTSYQTLEFRPPNRTFPIHEGLHLDIGDESFEIFYPGESHAPDNVVVYLKHRRILFGSCMIKGEIYKKPGFILHANMQEWPKAVKRVENRFTEAVTLVPGHGEIGGRELFEHMYMVLENWKAQQEKK